MNRPLANGSSSGADRVIKKRDENGFVVEQIQPNEEKQRRLRQQKKEEQDKPVIDAGLKSLDHCTWVHRYRRSLSCYISSFVATAIIKTTSHLT